MIDQAFVQPFLYLPTFLGIRVLSEGVSIVDLGGCSPSGRRRRSTR